MQRLREKKKITQVRLSTKVGVSHQSIACYETNQRISSLPVAHKIAKALDTSINGLFSDNIINKYYELPEEDKETINIMIESLYEKKNCKISATLTGIILIQTKITFFDGITKNTSKNTNKKLVSKRIASLFHIYYIIPVKLLSNIITTCYLRL